MNVVYFLSKKTKLISFEFFAK